jgi:hypothetical protein
MKRSNKMIVALSALATVAAATAHANQGRGRPDPARAAEVAREAARAGQQAVARSAIATNSIAKMKSGGMTLSAADEAAIARLSADSAPQRGRDVINDIAIRSERSANEQAGDATLRVEATRIRLDFEILAQGKLDDGNRSVEEDASIALMHGLIANVKALRDRDTDDSAAAREKAENALLLGKLVNDKIRAGMSVGDAFKDAVREAKSQGIRGKILDLLDANKMKSECGSLVGSIL